MLACPASTAVATAATLVAAVWTAIGLAPVTLMPASNNTVLTAMLASDLIFMIGVLLVL
jgi:hypothetical protein